MKPSNFARRTGRPSVAAAGRHHRDGPCCWRPLAFLSVLLALAGCQTMEPVQSDVARAAVAAPEMWSTASATAPIQPAWIVQLGDPRLPALVEEAITYNSDLKLAAARLNVAQAEARLEAAREGATIDLDASAARRGAPGGAGTRTNTNSFGASLDVAWEVDVWRRLTDGTQAATLQADARAADLSAARLSIAANVAQAWFNAITGELQVILAEDTVANFGENLSVVEDGFRSGLNAALDVRLERANLAGAKSRLASRRIDKQQTIRTLEMLLGRYPAGQLSPRQSMPAIQSTVPAGLPAQLLQRRPDLQAARLRVAASDRRQDAARKGRLPQFRLTSSGGLSSSELRSFLSFDSILWTLAAGLIAPIVDAGRIDAQIDLQAARTDETLVSYAAAVLQAFGEVESALASEALLAAQETALAEAASESVQAVELALERYRSGLVDIVTWLEARRRAFDARSNLIAVNNRRLQNRVALHLALGGDFGIADYTTAITIGAGEPVLRRVHTSPTAPQTGAALSSYSP